MEHFNELERKVGEFTRVNPYQKVVEQHPSKPDHVVHKIVLTEALPQSLADITGDIVQNLRNALDNAAYAVAVASGRTDPKFTAFPFAGSLSQMPQARVVYHLLDGEHVVLPSETDGSPSAAC